MAEATKTQARIRRDIAVSQYGPFGRLFYEPELDGVLPTVDEIPAPGRKGPRPKRETQGETVKKTYLREHEKPVTAGGQHAGWRHCAICNNARVHRQILEGPEQGVVFCTGCGWQRNGAEYIDRSLKP